MAKEPTGSAVPAAKTLYLARNFNDAGTGRSFTAGKLPSDLSDGEIENYRAAGLISDQRPTAQGDDA